MFISRVPAQGDFEMKIKEKSGEAKTSGIGPGSREVGRKTTS
jgi:hypothetical protein